MINNKRANDTIKAGELFATDVFGNIKISTNDILKIPFIENRNVSDENNKKVGKILNNKKPINAAKIIALKEKINELSKELRKETTYLNHSKKVRKPRILFSETIDNLSPLLCFYPYLSPQARAMTMNNARERIAQHNQKIILLNEKIQEYNCSVKKYKDESELTEIQIQYSKLFLIKNKGLKPSNYNDKAEEFNNEYGLLIQKRPEQKVKYGTEIVLQNMLYDYSLQLQIHSDEFSKTGLANIHPIKEYEVNSYKLVNLKRNGIHSLDVTTRTIRNHRERLEEAGIFFNYAFHGQKKGVTVHINPEILVVFDTKTQSFVTLENQSITSEREKNFPHNNEVLELYKNNINKKENGQADFLNKERSKAAGFSFYFYENIPQQEAKSKLGGGKKNVKVLNTLSEKLENSILPAQELAVKLASGEFNNYTLIDKRILYQESYKGTLSKEEMAKLTSQIFFKFCAKFYRNHNVFVGSWKKAINDFIEDNYFINNGNGRHLIGKEFMVNLLYQWIWRMQNSEHFYQKTGIKRLYPSDYFDKTRTEAKEIGFEYTKKSWINHLKYLENKPQLTYKKNKKAELRKININHSTKFDAAINKFFRNRIDYSQLIDYVDKNLPAEYLQKLSDRLIKLSNSKYTC